MPGKGVDDIVLLFSDARGIYIPRDFAETDIAKAHLSKEDLAILGDPDNEAYWETWDEVMNMTFTDKEGQVWIPHQDGDLWMIPVECEWDDETEWFKDKESE